MLKRFFRAILPWIVLVHSLLFLGFWLTNSVFYVTTNDYLAGMLGSRLDYILICLWVCRRNRIVERRPAGPGSPGQIAPAWQG